MHAMGITLLIWGVVIFAISIVVLIYAVKFFRAGRQLKLEMELAAKAADARLMMKYNRIATLDVDKLHSFLTQMFARCLEIVSDREISIKDPDGETTLFTLATQELALYLGPETIDAIDYYYGKNYITRWSKNCYKILCKRGVISSMITDKRLRAEVILKDLKN